MYIDLLFNFYLIRLMFLCSNLNTEHDTGVQQSEIIATPNFQQSLIQVSDPQYKNKINIIQV